MTSIRYKRILIKMPLVRRRKSGSRHVSIFSPLSILFASGLAFQTARGEVIEYVRYGPSCNSDTHLCKLTVKVEGKITSADYEKLKTLVDQTRAQAKTRNWDWAGIFVHLNSPGGSTDAAMAIGRLLRKEQAFAMIGYHPLDTQGKCYSACVLVLAGAVGRNMKYGKVGIHGPHLAGGAPNGLTGEDFQKTLHQLRRYFREMNLSPLLSDAMFRIEPKDIRLLSDDALYNYGFTSEDPFARKHVNP
jgi:hypothetical protein